MKEKEKIIMKEFFEENDKIIHSLQRFFIINKFTTISCITSMLMLSSHSFKIYLKKNKKEFLELVEKSWESVEESENLEKDE